MVLMNGVYRVIPRSLPKAVRTSGQGIQLRAYYAPNEFKSGVALTIPQLPYPRTGREAELHNYTLNITGQVQGVAFRATATNIFRAIGQAGVPGARFAPLDNRIFSADNQPDSSVTITMEATEPEKELFLSIVKPGAAFHVVFGTEDDFKVGKCVVVEAGRAVPKNAFAVYSPRIDGVQALSDQVLETTR